MEHNTYTQLGNKPLNYPHYTKWDERRNEIHIVTNPQNKIKKGDTICYGIERTNSDGTVEMVYDKKPVLVDKILEERPAKGIHQKQFKPLFQRISFTNLKPLLK